MYTVGTTRVQEAEWYCPTRSSRHVSLRSVRFQLTMLQIGKAQRDRESLLGNCTINYVQTARRYKRIKKIQFLRPDNAVMKCLV
jgi:hypothetical protein